MSLEFGNNQDAPMMNYSFNKVRQLHFILMPIPFGVAGLTMYLYYHVLSRLHSLLYPDTIIIGGWRETGFTIAIVPFILPALTFGFLVINKLLRLNSTLRNIAEKKGDYVSSQKFFIKAIVILLVAIIPLSTWGFFDYYYVTETQIVSNSLFSIRAKSFGWNDITVVKTKLFAAREVRLKYILQMRDGTEVDIGSCIGKRQISRFIKEYEQIKLFLGKSDDLLLQPDIRITEKDFWRRGYPPEETKRIFQMASLQDIEEN